MQSRARISKLPKKPLRSHAGIDLEGSLNLRSASSSTYQTSPSSANAKKTHVTGGDGTNAPLDLSYTVVIIINSIACLLKFKTWYGKTNKRRISHFLIEIFV